MTNESDVPLIAFFGHDSREATVQKRIISLEAHGCRILGFTFARRNHTERTSVPFENVHLGITVDRNYLRRLFPLIGALPKVLRHVHRLRNARVIYARNIDMLALATASKLLTGAQGRIVYEVLDVQRIFTGIGFRSRMMRALERRLLRSIHLLVVSSPEFMSRYFGPLQNYQGQWHLLENKISKPQVDAAGEAYSTRPSHPPSGKPWVIGWFGVLRCRKSLDLIAQIADRLGDGVRIHLRGRLSTEDISEEELRAVAASRPNIAFSGPYKSPEELAEIYGKIHFNWAVDYTDEGANSDWLLPNRIYEGGFFGAVALARRETATGRIIEERGLGISLAEPLEDSICRILERLNEETYTARRVHIAQLPRALFVDEKDTHELLARLGCSPCVNSKTVDGLQERYA